MRLEDCGGVSVPMNHAAEGGIRAVREPLKCRFERATAVAFLETLRCTKHLGSGADARAQDLSSWHPTERAALPRTSLP